MLSQFNEKWHEKAIVYLSIFTIITSLYSAFNLSGFFVADFFKNKIIEQVLFSHEMFTNTFNSTVGLVITLFFSLKILLAIWILYTNTNFKRMIIMFMLVMLCILEGIGSVGGDCVSNIGQIYDCGFVSIINPFATFITITPILIVMLKQIMITYKENKYLERKIV